MGGSGGRVERDASRSMCACARRYCQSACEDGGHAFLSPCRPSHHMRHTTAARRRAARVGGGACRVGVIRELRGLVERKEQFIALMSYELRSPLNAIIGLSTALLDSAASSAPPAAPLALRPSPYMSDRPASSVPHPPGTLCTYQPGAVAPSGAGDGEKTRMVAAIRNSGAWLLTLVNDLLDAAALQKVRVGWLCIELNSWGLAAVMRL